jgi:hypothetical protein
VLVYSKSRSYFGDKKRQKNRRQTESNQVYLNCQGEKEEKTAIAVLKANFFRLGKMFSKCRSSGVVGQGRKKFAFIFDLRNVDA